MNKSVDISETLLYYQNIKVTGCFTGYIKAERVIR